MHWFLLHNTMKKNTTRKKTNWMVLYWCSAAAAVDSIDVSCHLLDMMHVNVGVVEPVEIDDEVHKCCQHPAVRWYCCCNCWMSLIGHRMTSQRKMIERLRWGNLRLQVDERRRRRKDRLVPSKAHRSRRQVSLYIPDKDWFSNAAIDVELKKSRRFLLLIIRNSIIDSNIVFYCIDKWNKE